MKTSVLVILIVILFFLLINIIFEYTHTFNLKRSKYKNNNNQILLQLFLHIHIINEIISNCFYNCYVKLKIIIYSIFIFITYDKKKDLQNIQRTENGEIYYTTNDKHIQNNSEILYSRFNNGDNCDIKTLYFIRHSESVWNHTFNKSVKGKKALNIFLIFFYEIIFLFSSRSVLFDSPLSVLGIIQSLELSNFLKSYKNENTLNEDEVEKEKEKEKENEKEKEKEKEKKNTNDALINQLKSYDNNIIANYDSRAVLEKSYELGKRLLRINKTADSTSGAALGDSLKQRQTDNNCNERYLNEQKKCFHGRYFYRHEEYDPEKLVNLSINEHIDILNRKKHNSSILCSNLRRTISSCFISFYNRLHNFNENIYVLNSLQERSRNPDCVSLFPFYNKYITTDMEIFLHKDADNVFKKSIQFANYDESDNAFKDTLDYIFSEENNIFIIFGHSLWISFFLNSFLKSPYKKKTQKLQNSAILLLNVARYVNDKNEYVYEIIDNSIRNIYKGFEETKN